MNQLREAIVRFGWGGCDVQALADAARLDAITETDARRMRGLQAFADRVVTTLADAKADAERAHRHADHLECKLEEAEWDVACARQASERAWRLFASQYLSDIQPPPTLLSWRESEIQFSWLPGKARTGRLDALDCDRFANFAELALAVRKLIWQRACELEIR